MSNDVLDQIASAVAESGDLSDFAPNLGSGSHLICLQKIETRDSREYGKKIDIEFVIVESTSHTKGEVRGDVFFISRNGDAGSYARKRANAFSKAVVSSLGGNPDDTSPVTVNGKTMQKGALVVAQTLGRLLDKGQPGKGILLRVDTRKRGNKEKTKEYDNNTYSPVTQTKEDIGKRRAAMEAGASTAGAPTAPAAAATATTPAANSPAAAVPNMLDGIL